MAKLKPVYIIEIQRSAVCRSFKGGFSKIRPDDLLAEILKKTITKTNKKFKSDIANLVEDVIIGCAMPEGMQGLNIARITSLLAGLPSTVPAMTLNRFCASGLQSIAQGAHSIAAGGSDLIIAGGVESMSAIPMVGNTPRPNPKLFLDESDADIKALSHSMGVTAENLAKRYKISRKEQDEFAYNSHQKALKAQSKGLFKSQICEAFGVVNDEGPRKDTSVSKLSKLKTSFAAENIAGSVTAGNSSQVSDGASVCVLASEKFIKKHNITPLARFCGYQLAGVAPDVMGLGPVCAVPKVLNQVGIKDKDLNWIELNEAFSAQALAVCRDLGWDSTDKRLNPNGGAIALGHPLGATGSILVSKLVHGVGRSKSKSKGYGLVTLCVGGWHGGCWGYRGFLIYLCFISGFFAIYIACL